MKIKKSYIYTRVSTSIQVDGYSLDAQRKNFIDTPMLRRLFFCPNKFQIPRMIRKMHSAKYRNMSG